MASFAQFLGRKVTVEYRVGDILLPASGLFAADSGRSIFLEQHVEQRGKRSYFRWEIPYQFIHRIEATEEAVGQEPTQEEISSEVSLSQAAAAGAGSGTSADAADESSAGSFLSLPQRPKIA